MQYDAIKKSTEKLESSTVCEPLDASLASFSPYIPENGDAAYNYTDVNS